MTTQLLRNLRPFLLFTVGCLAGCRGAAPPTPVATAPQPAAPVLPPAAPTITDDKPAPSKTPIKDCVEAFLAEQSHAAHPLLPSGVRLLKADLADGVVTLDFSSEFNGLANMGDSVEGEAQKALCAALAQIPGVEKLKVTVVGQPYDSQMADWSTPFPVRTASASTSGGGAE